MKGDFISTASDGTRAIERPSPAEDAPTIDDQCADCGRPADGIYELVPCCWECAGQRAADRENDRDREDR